MASVLLSAVFASLWLIAAEAIILNGTHFREAEYVCAVRGRLVGACQPPGACDAAPRPAPRRLRSCGLSGAGAGALRCCPPLRPPPEDALHGRRALQACQRYGERQDTVSCYNFRSPDGSTKVYAGDYPYFAAVGYANETAVRWECGGALVSETFVVTAATCATENQHRGGPVAVRLGDVDLRGADGDSEAQQYAVAETFLHPRFKNMSLYHNIALLRMSGKARISQAVRPACMYPESVYPFDSAVVAGIGMSSFMDEEHGLLQKVDLPITDDATCKKAYEPLKNRLANGIDKMSMICAGEQGRDSCRGDSGSPLAVKVAAPLCSHAVVGLSSFGTGSCGWGKPGVYTRLYPYLPWIESIVWP